MRTHEQMKQAAADVVAKMLTGRLERAGVFTSRPELCFQCEGDRIGQNAGGAAEVRVKTWRHWSDARVNFDADDGKLLGYSIDRWADPPSEAEMSREDALQAAREAIEIPPDAVLQSFYHVQYAPRRKAARLRWTHVHQGLRVDGDVLWIIVHPETGRVIEYFCKWREVDVR